MDKRGDGSTWSIILLITTTSLNYEKKKKIVSLTLLKEIKNTVFENKHFKLKKGNKVKIYGRSVYFNLATFSMMKVQIV